MSYIEALLDWLGKYNQGIVSLGVFVAAGAAIWGSYKTAHSSHSTRISELRQTWIEGLRQDVVGITTARIIHIRRQLNEIDNNEYINQITDTKLLSTKIKLKLNHDEKEHAELMSAIDVYMAENDVVRMGEKEKTMIAAARKIFRKEWKRAVRGAR